jgi:ubiquinone/menaquinone biosynthesis C-methylase UbiE
MKYRGLAALTSALSTYTGLYFAVIGISPKNQAVYSRAGIVRYYTQIHALQPAERAILEQLSDRLPTLKMLDIGIGGGRTTHHFHRRVGDYTGIDYSAAMIAACQQRFSQASPSPTLAVVDARHMEQFPDSSFDLILFSFNGIDYVSHRDRLQILQEIHRVGKPGAYVVFSSHNLQALAHDFDYRQQISFNPLKTYVNLVMWALVRRFNRAITLDRIKTADHLILRDEAHNFRLQTYYIRPEQQIQQLAFGFHSIDVYPWQQGEKVAEPGDLAREATRWLYYVCVVNNRPKGMGGRV